MGEREGVLEELKGDWKATYSFIKPGDGWSAMDFRHRDAIQEAVSYTHLDVYKRQRRSFSWMTPTTWSMVSR